MNFKYANHIGYSDINPYEIIKYTAKTITIRAMDTTLKDGWKPEIILGGFAGHCINQDTQQWNIISNINNPTIKAYLRKDNYYHSYRGRHSLSIKPIKFYDYNF